MDLAGLALILAGQTWTRVLEAEMTEPRWALTLGVGLILLAAYLGVRVLKKQGVLRP